MTFVPSATPSPATLHTLSWPVSKALVKITVVWVDTLPSATATVADRAARSRLMRRAAGLVEMSVTSIPGRATSVTVAVPAGSSNAGEHAPTGTDTVRPFTTNSNLPLTPGPLASLQISMNPLPGLAASTRAGTARNTKYERDADPRSRSDGPAAPINYIHLFKVFPSQRALPGDITRQGAASSCGQRVNSS